MKLAEITDLVNEYRIAHNRKPEAIYEGRDCIRRLVDQAQSFFINPVTKDPSLSTLYGIPVIVDPTVPRGMAYMDDAKGNRVWVDMRTDEEKAEDFVPLSAFSTIREGGQMA